jgi:hypothetical protein
MKHYKRISDEFPLGAEAFIESYLKENNSKSCRWGYNEERCFKRVLYLETKPPMKEIFILV